MLEFTIIVDDRERLPLTFEAPTRIAHLPAGDYAAVGCTDLVALERKRVDELATCCGIERDRFIEQIRRLRSYPVRGLIIEGDLRTIAAGRYRSKIRPASVIGTLLKFSVDWSIPIWLCGDAAHAAIIVEKTLRRVHAHQDEIRAALTRIAELEPELLNGGNCAEVAT